MQHWFVQELNVGICAGQVGEGAGFHSSAVRKWHGIISAERVRAGLVCHMLHGITGEFRVPNKAPE